MHHIVKSFLSTLQAAVAKYGPEAQRRQLLEELAELQVAVLHHQREKATKADVVTEMADVTIMLAQLQIMLAVSNEVLEREIRRKLNRLADKLVPHA